jgi:uncharacterized iron-regulated membrane protein
VSTNAARSSGWQRWVRQPQKVWLRRAIFQVHLWAGIGLGLYVFFISATGSVLVYRNELYVAVTPEAFTLSGTPAEAEANVPLGMWLVDSLIDAHDNLLSGRTGRLVNGAGAIAVLLMCLTGAVLWWPGIARWREHLVLRRGVGWRRFTWQLHGVVGFWSFAFLLVLALSGMYLCFPDQFAALADWLTPPTNENAGTRFVDSALYWLAYLHFGRINGIGIPCGGPGLCDQTTKLVWAIGGAMPAAMFVTGAIMWWNRVVRRWLRKSRSARLTVAQAAPP